MSPRVPLVVAALTLSSCGLNDNNCVNYERALEACYEQSFSSADTGVDTGGETSGAEIAPPEVECPSESELDAKTDRIYSCLTDVWGQADCRDAEGVFEASIAAGECGFIEDEPDRRK